MVCSDPTEIDFKNEYHLKILCENFVILKLTVLY